MMSKRFVSIGAVCVALTAYCMLSQPSLASDDTFYEGHAITGIARIKKLDKHIKSLPSVSVRELRMLPLAMIKNSATYLDGSMEMICTQYIDGKKNKSYYILEKGGYCVQYEWFAKVYDQDGKFLYYMQR